MSLFIFIFLCIFQLPGGVGRPFGIKTELHKIQINFPGENGILRRRTLWHYIQPFPGATFQNFQEFANPQLVILRR